MPQRHSRRSSEQSIPFTETTLCRIPAITDEVPNLRAACEIVTGPMIHQVRSASTIRIVCVSDTHFYHQHLKLPEGDILVHAGDFMGFGDMERHIAEFNQWLGEQPQAHKIVIAGNHDSLFESSPGVARALLTNAIYLENSGVELEGLRFWGSPVQPTFHEWAFNVDRGDPIRRYWAMIPAGTDILVTHGPPFGILDQEGRATPHLGCEELAKAVQRVEPKLHIFGHIHGGYGELRSANGPHFINASVLKKKHMHFNHPYVVDVAL